MPHKRDRAGGWGADLIAVLEIREQPQVHGLTARAHAKNVDVVGVGNGRA